MHWHGVLCVNIALDTAVLLMQNAQLLARTFCGSDSNSGAHSTDIQVVSCVLVLS